MNLKKIAYEDIDKAVYVFLLHQKEKFNKNDLTTLIKAGLSLLDVKPVVGWLIKIKPNDSNDVNDLLDAEGYKALVNE